MSAGTGKPKTVAAFRAGNQGRSNVPTDPSSIDLDIVMGTKDRKDTVGGVDTTYQKPPSSFFSFAGQPSYSSVQSLCEKFSVCKLKKFDAVVVLCQSTDYTSAARTKPQFHQQDEKAKLRGSFLKRVSEPVFFCLFFSSALTRESMSAVQS
jgi:hypothetical protein